MFIIASDIYVFKSRKDTDIDKGGYVKIDFMKADDVTILPNPDGEEEEEESEKKNEENKDVSFFVLIFLLAES